MNLVRRAGIALILAAVGGAAPPWASTAAAQNADCESLPKPILYGVGGSAQRPLFSVCA